VPEPESLHPASLDGPDLLAECERTFGRGSGPGGQHRNKVQTLVKLTHRPTGTAAHAGERRSQAQNQRVALRRLRLALATTVRVGRPAAAGPSALWRCRCVGGRLACNAEHDDYPTLLAEAMDAVWSFGLDVPAAAQRLGVSASQLVKLIAKHPAALAQLNAARDARGLGPLRG